MGLYGALIVRPATAGQAYDDAATAFDDEAVLVLSEIDPALNNSANPATFDMRNYAPKYFLINGKAYPDTDPIASAAGNKVLLRYVNAGIQQHSMGSAGPAAELRRQGREPAADARPTTSRRKPSRPGRRRRASSRFRAGDDASKFAVYDGSLMLRNSNAAGFGGMLTFVDAGASSEPAGPTTSAVALCAEPDQWLGDQSTLSATITGGATREPSTSSMPLALTAVAVATTSATSIAEIIPVSGAIARRAPT